MFHPQVLGEVGDHDGAELKPWGEDQICLNLSWDWFMLLWVVWDWSLEPQILVVCFQSWGNGISTSLHLPLIYYKIVALSLNHVKKIDEAFQLQHRLCGTVDVLTKAGLPHCHSEKHQSAWFDSASTVALCSCDDFYLLLSTRWMTKTNTHLFWTNWGTELDAQLRAWSFLCRCSFMLFPAGTLAAPDPTVGRHAEQVIHCFYFAFSWTKLLMMILFTKQWESLWKRMKDDF